MVRQEDLMVSNTAFITVTISICVAFLGAMGSAIYAMTTILGAHIDDVVGRLDRLEARLEQSIEPRLDGIAETLVRFDERLRHLEEHAR